MTNGINKQRVMWNKDMNTISYENMWRKEARKHEGNTKKTSKEQNKENKWKQNEEDKWRKDVKTQCE